MIIDTHIHESKYSFDSILDLETSIKLARLIGLDGICITNHENNHLRDEIGDSARINGVLVIVGSEILTHEGDILTFGLKDIT
ncbi:MAG: PHP domain-containing protein, partial [Candidatus Alkaliphilus sp. MAG34]